MKIGFLFPGQGSQSVGMGKDLYNEYEEIRNFYKKASDILGIDIKELTFNSTEEELAQTQNTQIAVFTMSMAILELLKKNNINSNYLAGLSLGEYTALTYANAFDFETAIKIIAKRGQIMQNNIPEGHWEMAGVLGLSDNEVEQACKMVSNGFVVPANYNCPGQVVVSGEENAVAELTEKAKQMGARKVSVIKANGPFHTAKLKKASNELRVELQKIKINNPDKNVYKNLDGLKYMKNDDIVEILSSHIKNPVHFSTIIENMINDGVDTFVEIGPGKVLTGLVKRVSHDVKLININSVNTLNEAILELKEEN